MDPLTGTANFAVDEWERVSEGETPAIYRANAQRTLDALQRVRDALGVPVIITNGWRSPSHNSIIPGSAHNSQHLTAEGVDFDVPSLSKRQVATALDAAEASGDLGQFHQLIYYQTDNHYHLGVGTGNEKLVKVSANSYAPYTGPDSLPDAPVSALTTAASNLAELGGNIAAQLDGTSDGTLGLAFGGLALAALFLIRKRS